MINFLAIVIVGVVALALGWVVAGLRQTKENITKTDFNEKIEGLGRVLREEAASARREQAEAAKLGREEMQKSITGLGDLLGGKLKDAAESQARANNAFGEIIKGSLADNAGKVKDLTLAVSLGLEKIQKDSEQKLEKIRETVDEKLHATLEKRLGDSFKLVSERLENVQKGLGEMQSLANGVGDLKKVLTNVKTRGIWGEVLLGGLLEQILSPEQYEANVATTKTNERVEYAVKLPGKNDENNTPVWIPIDSKFPKEDYERLVAAQEIGDAALAAEAGKSLETSIKKFAQDIFEKYIEPPKTTDFGIMFLPSESLYAEVIRRTSVMETLQQKYHIQITGPTTLAAFLNSLQMGFRTLAIQKRSSEVWETLGAVKTEFEKYSDLMEKVKKKLDEASNTIDQAGTRTKAISRRLKNVEKLSDQKTAALLPVDITEDESV